MILFASLRMTFVTCKVKFSPCLPLLFAAIHHMCRNFVGRFACFLSLFIAAAVGTAACAEHPSETSVATPRVISITQLTHDGRHAHCCARNGAAQPIFSSPEAIAMLPSVSPCPCGENDLSYRFTTPTRYSGFAFSPASIS